jgi:HEAT repeat protein
LSGERSIDVPDPDPPAGERAEAPAASPYRNLLVPLVVVPFLIVCVLVLVFLFFGRIAGQEATLEENLERLVHGGSNESKQAAMNLSSQAAENARAKQEGRPEPWPAGSDFPARLDQAWNELEEDDDHLRLAVAQLGALYGAPEAFEKLAAILHLPDERDPQGHLRAYAMVALTWSRDPRAAGEVIPFLRHPDAFLRQAAAAVLQELPGERSADALAALLDDPSLELRGQAAISLSHLGDARGAAVLVELVERESYDALHRDQPRKYASEGLIQTSRFKALEALARLRRPEDRALFERVARDDADPLVREAAMRALQAR